MRYDASAAGAYFDELARLVGHVTDPTASADASFDAVVRRTLLVARRPS